jgi:hypothetical protein
MLPSDFCQTVKGKAEQEEIRTTCQLFQNLTFMELLHFRIVGNLG